jgi:hypothetical protein
VELDHLFIASRLGAPGGDVLREFGLMEGSGNVHPGQGTANRRFFFANAMLELLWVDDEDMARGEGAARLGLAERCASVDPTVSPFGVCFRPSPGHPVPLFDTWSYRPPYLPPALSIQVAPVSMHEPLWFFIGFSGRPDRINTESREPIDHSVKLREITAVRIASAYATDLSSTARQLRDLGLVAFDHAKEHLMEIEFDGADGGLVQDFRPQLPLSFRW